MIESSFYDLRNLHSAPDADAVVVIDVLRAFSTAAAVLDRGALEIYPVLDVAEAWALRTHEPDLVLIGENNCQQVPGFDWGNSPIITFPFFGRRVVQRTTAGTRGLVCCSGARSLWASSFLVASSTITALQTKKCRRVAFVLTGTVHYGSADEDLACAEWMAELLRNKRPPVTPFLQRVKQSVAAATFLDPSSPLYAPNDVHFCARADLFSFALNVNINTETKRLTISQYSTKNHPST